jgi:hypothetical protein
MPNKVPSKGTALLMEISSVYTAFPQITSISISGEKAETVDTTTLDGGAPKTKANTGYVDNATISGECLYDPDDTVHIAFITKVRAAGVNNFKITFADTTPMSEIYSGLGLGFDRSVSPADMLRGSFTIETTGAVT